ncbi:BglII/BstYI family type II restriction endonuclease [Sulfurimonas sp.]|uniref:BglII/BstYI family type II restriction endonuclease n=1 Tax=Sulfurimonas sp. TaxID=2022749 RepID=UPI002B48F13B|nr:BglII/BstYI family type II restriction endonuclease [Sulfurimonas sp.]
MKYKLKSYRYGELILNNEPQYKDKWNELLETIESITDEEIIEAHESNKRVPKGLSVALNKVIKKKLIDIGWKSESRIFNDNEYSNKSWRLDFANDNISIEVAFNHGEAIAWNLVKPTIASELNHVQKEIKTDIAIVICATKNLKTLGGFDGATGEFEKFERYLDPLRGLLTVPMVIIGLEAPETFKIEHNKVGNTKQGIVKRY